jgi:hypothetical protein
VTIPRDQIGWVFWLQWVVASTVGFALGATAIGAAGRPLGDTAPTFIGASVLYITVVVAATLPGFLHWLILRRRFAHTGWWVLASGIGSLLGYFVTGLGLGVEDTQGNATFAHLAVPASTAVAGAAVGILQWVVLRRWVSRAGWWVLASSIAWVVASFVYLTLTRGNDVHLTLGGAVSGALSGAVTGFVLVGLTRTGQQSEPSIPGAGAIVTPRAVSVWTSR